MDARVVDSVEVDRLKTFARSQRRLGRMFFRHVGEKNCAGGRRGDLAVTFHNGIQLKRSCHELAPERRARLLGQLRLRSFGRHKGPHAVTSWCSHTSTLVPRHRRSTAPGAGKAAGGTCGTDQGMMDPRRRRDRIIAVSPRDPNREERNCVQLGKSGHRRAL